MMFQLWNAVSVTPGGASKIELFNKWTYGEADMNWLIDKDMKIFIGLCLCDNINMTHMQNI